MSLTAGTRLGPYEIVGAIGAGGMGEVYKARDTRLGRDVAIKVLSGTLAADPEARARFEREARAVSQLNHPHICALYDVGDGFLVMEYLEGESLAARLEKGPIPADEALDYALQIADALDKAHRQGIVHRDLKPANVMLVKGGAARSVATSARTGPGIAKLLDFGLAKLAPPPAIGSLETVMAGSAAPSASRTPGAGAKTAEGTILGTFQYMAPEQVEAHEVDARTDIWAFGCLLYEMLTGKRAFEGRTSASLIAAIIGKDPTPVTELQPLTPPALGRVIRICLAKDPNARFQSSYDLLLQLQWISEGGSAAGLPAPVIEHRKNRERLMWLAVAAAALAIGAAGAWALKPAPVISNVTSRFSFPLPESQAFSRTGRRYVAISPNGKRMAYIADSQIYLREMDQLTSSPIVGTKEDPLDLVFSPDGLSLAYFIPTGNAGPLSSDRSFMLKKIQIGGGTPVPLCTTGWPYGVTWQGNTIAFGQNSNTVHGIMSVADTAGTPIALVTVANTHQASLPQLLDEGRLVLFTHRLNTAGSANWDDAEIVVQAPGDKEPTVLVKAGTDGRVVGGDRLLYYRNGTMFGIGLDLSARRTIGGPVPIVTGVQSATTGTGAGEAAIADQSGTLIFVPGSGAGADGEPRQLVWMDRQGKMDKIPAPDQAYRLPRISPDGSRVVLAVESASASRLFTWEFGRNVLSPLTPAGDQQDSFPAWLPDGRSVVYRSGAPDGSVKIMRIDASGARAPELVLDLGKPDAPLSGVPYGITPDGKAVLMRMPGAGGQWDLVAGPIEGSDKKLRPLLTSAASESNGIVSPDGRWLAYSLSEGGGISQALMRPYPDVTADRWPVSTENATDLAWSPTSRELFYVHPVPTEMRVVTVQPGPVPVFSKPTTLFDMRPFVVITLTGVDFDVAKDGRLLMITRRAVVDETVKPTIVIVTHWIDELKARVK